MPSRRMPALGGEQSQSLQRRDARLSCKPCCRPPEEGCSVCSHARKPGAKRREQRLRLQRARKKVQGSASHGTRHCGRDPWTWFFFLLVSPEEKVAWARAAPVSLASSDTAGRQRLREMCSAAAKGPGRPLLCDGNLRCAVLAFVMMASCPARMAQQPRHGVQSAECRVQRPGVAEMRDAGGER